MDNAALERIAGVDASKSSQSSSLVPAGTPDKLPRRRKPLGRAAESLGLAAAESLGPAAAAVKDDFDDMAARLEAGDSALASYRRESR